jgi:hypothetical protein
MSRGFKGKGLASKRSYTKKLANIFEAVACDGDAAVDGRT